MADAILIYFPDKKAAAKQIAEAGRAAGYEVALAEFSEPDGPAIVERARTAPAALLIWSRPLVSSAMIDNWLPALRRLANVIEVSTDGIAPDSGDPGRVVLLSGWRGQPFHLGWQRVLDELKPFAAGRAEPHPRAAGRAAPADKGSATPRQRAGVRRLTLPALALLGVAAAASVVAWSGSSPSGEETVVEIHSSRSIAPVQESAPAAAAAQLPTGGGVDSGVSDAPPQPAVRLEVGTSAGQDPRPRDKAERTAAKAPASKAKRVRTERKPSLAPPVKHYSKRHSKTMRRFCERSGRSTPECRTFLRSMRATDD